MSTGRQIYAPLGLIAACAAFDLGAESGGVGAAARVVAALAAGLATVSSNSPTWGERWGRRALAAGWAMSGAVLAFGGGLEAFALAVSVGAAAMYFLAAPEGGEGPAPTISADLALTALWALTAWTLARSGGGGLSQAILPAAPAAVGAALFRARRGQGDAGLVDSLGTYAACAWLTAAAAAVGDRLGAEGLLFAYLIWALAVGGARSVGEARRSPRPAFPDVEALGVLLAAAAAWAAGMLQSSAVAPAVVAILAVRRAAVSRVERAERNRAELEAGKLRNIIENINDAVVTLDLDGARLHANRRFDRMFGVRSSEDRRRFEEYFHPDDRLLLRRQLRRSIEDREDIGGIEYRARRADGSEFHVECSIASLEAGGIRVGVQAVLRDVTDRKLIERSQKALTQRLEFFVNEMPLGCVIWDLDFTVQEWNSSAERIFGWTAAEALNRSYSEFLAVEPDDAVEQSWPALARSRCASSQPCRNRTRDGETIDCEWFHTSLVDDQGAVVGVASMAQDVSHRRCLERQLLQAQKMEAVGNLVGGVAHDFNNLLTSIVGNITLTRMRLGPSHEASKWLADAETAGARATDLTHQLLRFSRKGPVERRVVRIGERAREVVELFQYGLDQRIRVSVEIQPDLHPVLADEGQIGQVLMNLCVNARDAVQKEGAIRVEAFNFSASPEFCLERPWAEPRDYVVLRVADDGVGMDERTKARIFEPFFTTKPVGKGTGLGLATAYGIVQSHGGGIEVDSEPGQGAKFSIYVPRADEAAPNLERPGDSSQRTILLVDGRLGARGLARDVLRREGYRVFEARDGEEGLRVLEGARGNIDLVMLEAALRRYDANGSAEKLRRAAADVPLIETPFGRSPEDDASIDDEREPTLSIKTAGRLLAAVRAALKSANQAKREAGDRHLRS